MRITRSDSQKLVVLDFPWLIGLIACPLGAGMLWHGGRALYRAGCDGRIDFFGRGSSGIWGPLLAAALCFLLSAAAMQRSEFVFDFVSRKLTWRRRGVFVNKGGVVPLDQVRAAFVKENDGSEGPTYTVALKTDAGELPLSEIYTSGEARFLRIRDAINAALEETAPPRAGGSFIPSPGIPGEGWGEGRTA